MSVIHDAVVHATSLMRDNAPQQAKKTKNQKTAIADDGWKYKDSFEFAWSKSKRHGRALHTTALLMISTMWAVQKTPVVYMRLLCEVSSAPPLPPTEPLSPSVAVLA